MRALRYTDIEIMVGIPNEMLATLASSPKAAEKWVSKNMTAHLPGSGANIRSGTVRRCTARNRFLHMYCWRIKAVCNRYW
ncbi:hypothetical protein AgCh_005024 [Apium graveolens]